MMIEVLGINTDNKGALLMLEAICTQIRDNLPNARIAVPDTVSYETRMAYSLYCTFRRDRWKTDLSGLMGILPKKARTKIGLVAPQEIDVILDASGFGYGDYWGLEKLKRRLAGPLQSWRNGRNRAIVLPQALGPFEKPGMREAFQSVLKNANLVFVRDKTSMRYVEAVGGNQSVVRFAADFTNLLHADLPARLAHLAGKSIIIPNEKLITNVDAVARETYVAFLRKALELIEDTGREAVILIHEGAGDRRLAKEVDAVADRKHVVVDEPSPMVTKAVIAAGDLVVSSRFHGLVSALAAGVPALACGWSHKYSELMADYDCPGFSVDLADSSSWNDRLRDLLEAADQPAFRKRIATAAARERTRSEKMWAEVMALLKGEGHRA